MRTSPVVSKAALAHSTSEVDLSVLSRDGGGDDEGSENKSSNGDEVRLPKHFLHPTNTNNLSAQPPSRPCHESLPWDIERPSSLDNSHSGSPGYDTLSNKGDESPFPPEKTPAKPTAGKSSLKHKSLYDQLQLVADSQTQAHYKIAKMQAEERGDCADHKANTKWQGAFEVEHLRIQFQHEESLRHHENLAAQHAHELMILDRQIELEQAKTGGPMSNINNINPAFC